MFVLLFTGVCLCSCVTCLLFVFCVGCLWLILWLLLLVCGIACLLWFRVLVCGTCFVYICRFVYVALMFLFDFCILLYCLLVDYVVSFDFVSLLFGFGLMLTIWWFIWFSCVWDLVFWWFGLCFGLFA